MFALLAELAILEFQQISEQTCNQLANLLIASKVPIKSAPTITENAVLANVALSSVSIPLYPESKQLTFNQGNMVSYSVNVPAEAVAKFYTAGMSSQGWRNLDQIDVPVIRSNNLDKFTVSLNEDQVSKKTIVTYSYLSPQLIKVLGTELTPDDPTSSSADTGSTQTPLDNNQQPLQEQQQTSGQDQTCKVNGVDLPGTCDLYNSSSTNSAVWGRPVQNRQPGQSSQTAQTGQSNLLKQGLKKILANNNLITATSSIGQRLEKILSPDQIKFFDNIEKVGSTLFGIRKQTQQDRTSRVPQQTDQTPTSDSGANAENPNLFTATSSIGQRLEKILSPDQIKFFDNIEKVGSILFGIRKNASPKPVFIEPTSASCVKDAINKKVASLKTAMSNRDQANLALLDTRTACELAALDKTTAQDQSDANQLCISADQKAKADNETSFMKTSEAIRKTFQAEVKQCIGTSNNTVTINSDSTNNTQ